MNLSLTAHFYFMKRFITGIALSSMLFVFYSCQQEVTFENSGSPSTGTLKSDVSGDCMPMTATGIYIAGNSLVGTTHYIQIEVDVTAPGSYTIYTDTVNGYYFRAMGVFSSTGIKQVTLRGNGALGAEGTNNFTVHYGLQSCSVAVTVLPAGTTSAVFTINCIGAVVNGTYNAGTALTSSNTVVLPVTVTTAGPYSITTTSVNGMVFSGTGNLTTSSTSITLTGSGTPGTDGTSAINVSSGSGSCSFNVTVNTGGGGGDLKWRFTQGSTVYEGPTAGAFETSAGGWNSVGVVGTSTIPNGDYSFSLGVAKAGSMSTGTFSTTSTTNTATFFLINIMTSEQTFSSMLGNGSNLTVNLTTYNPTTKIVQGTFSGTAKNAAGANVNITNGTFKAEIQ